MNDKKQRKIMQIITKSNWGGAQKYVYELSTELSNDDFEVCVACGGDGLLTEKIAATKIPIIKIKSLDRNINFIKDIKVFFELIKIIKKEKPDVIHLHSSKIGGIGCLAGRLCRVKKIIFTLHGLAFKENRSWFSKFIIKKIYWWTILLSHKTLLVSNGIREELLKDRVFGVWFKLLKRKMVVAKNEIKPIVFHSREYAREELSKLTKLNLENKTVVGTIAELHHIKGLNYLIDAATKIHEKESDKIFIIFGDGEEKENLEKQIVENGMGNKFFLLGFREDASEFITGFDIFVLPSLSEGLALVLLEAKQTGIPIIASNVGGVPEALEDYEQKILIKPENTPELKNSINNIETGVAHNKQTSHYSNMYQKILRTY